MPTIAIRYAFGRPQVLEKICLDEQDMTISRLLSKTSICSTFSSNNFYVTHNGKRLESNTRLDENNIYTIVGKLNGGKGGFGSLLRSIGAQIEKTTNKEACRDLSGRRMRDLKNEQSIKEWMSKAKERDEEAQQKKAERKERLRRDFKHKFEDPKYFEQKDLAVERMDEALKSGLEKVSSTTEPGTSGLKRKSTDQQKSSKKLCAMFDDSDLSESNDEMDDEKPEEISEDSSGASSSDKPQDNAEASPERKIEDCSDNSRVNNECKPDNSSEVSSQDKTENNFEKQSESIPSSSQTPENDCHLLTKEAIVEPDSSTEAQQVSSTNTDENKIDGQNKVKDNEDKAVEKKLEDKDTRLSSSVEINKNEPSKETIKDIDLLSYSNVKELEELGLDVLKFALQSRGLKCGGTLQQRAERLFSVKNLKPHQIDKSLLAKSKNAKK
ncbi:DgyrCDS2045 [Dimorphilus gyrociliatus]|uniref:DgyrCDS2045 n=1 Tax=Dimorphilus gyrociliatus TaxID=2664684 RepID=A0A7I8VAW1_9ANNE|nr:DgyrCDS2045 [Dimorphilus gyrociliatus]